MTTLETEFTTRCLKRTNDLHREASREFNRILFSFVTLGLLLILLAFALIELKWQPGRQDARHTGWVEIRP